MDHLDYRSQRVMMGAGIAAGASTQQQEGGAQALATATDDMLGDLANQHDVGGETLAQDAIDDEHVVAQNGLE